MLHHTFRKGQKVLVILKTGTSYVGKFLGTKSNNHLHLDIGTFDYKDINNCTLRELFINKVNIDGSSKKASVDLI